MKYFVISLFTIALSLGFSSCKNDLKVFAPGSESVSVYGILNPNEPVQNIRINKVYLTEGDALVAGQDGNQINYGAGELTVTLKRFMTGSTTPTLTTKGNAIKKEIILTETVVTTQAGAFSQNQRLWQTTDRLFNTGDYLLTIKNNATGATFTSQTTIVDSVKSFGLQQPMPFLYIPSQPALNPLHGFYPNPVQPTDKPKYVNYDVFTQSYQIKFRSVANARLYGVVMRFHYIDSLIGGGAQSNFVDYNFSTFKSDDLLGGSFLVDGAGISYFKFIGNDFYTSIGASIAAKGTPNIKNRRAYYMEFIVTAGSENLSDFLQINAPSTTIAQDKPLYSNITGGVGVFASRSTSIVTKDLWNDFIDKIACHSSTYPLLFCNSSGVPSSGTCN